MTTKQKSRLFLRPFKLVWDLLALILNLIGRLLAGVLGMLLMIFGIIISLELGCAPVGIPFAVFGLLLMIRSIF
jgi:hypothetical protein